MGPGDRIAIARSAYPLMSFPSPAPVPTDSVRTAIPLSRITIGLVALLLLANSLAVIFLIHNARTEALNTQLRENANLASVLQEQTTRVLASADQVTLRLADAMRESAVVPDLPRLATETGLSQRILVQLSLVGPDGRFIASNLDPTGLKTGPIDLSEREHIQAHLKAGPPSSTGLFIGQPVLGKVSKRWTLQLSRGIRGGDGRLLGVAVASLDPAYFEDVFGTVQLGQQGSVSLLGHDLRVRAQVVGQRPLGMGTSAPAQGLLANLPHSRSGQRIGPVGEDGEEQVQAFQRVGDYPLVVQVTSIASETLDHWRSTRNLILLLATLAAVVVVGVSIPFVRHLRRLESAHGALLGEQSEIQQQLKARNEWLMTLVQRLRTPITSQLGAASWLHSNLDPGLRQQALQMQQDTECLARMLDDVSDIARLEAGGMPLNLELLSLHPLVHAVTEPQRAAAAAKGLAMRIHFDPDVPERIRCDGIRVRQVLARLLANAIAHTTHGEVAVEIDVVPGWLRLQVADTGVGMSAERHAELLPREPTQTSPLQARGLGLQLGQALARHMGGRLQLESVPGMGSRFTLNLPLID